MRSVLIGGDILDTQPIPVALAETLSAQQSAIGRIYRTVYQRCKVQRQLVIDKFPKLNRFLTGYDLRHVFNDEMSEFDLTRILTGSEGTLAFITEARLDITRLPKVRRLVNVKYDSFNSALRNAPFMVEAGRSRSKPSTRKCLIWRAKISSGIRSASSLPTWRIKRCWG